MKKFLPLFAIGAVVIAVGAYFYGSTHPARGSILGVQRVGGGVVLNVVQYERGDIQLIAFDVDTKTKIGEIDLPATYDKDGKVFTPYFTSAGDVWQRGAFTFDDVAIRGCQRNIVFVSRTEKRMNLSTTHYCIEKTVDKHDITLFFGDSDDDGKTMAIGEFDGGKIRASAPAELDYELIPAWDNSRVLLFHAEDAGSKASAKLWNLRTSTVTDIVLPKQVYQPNVWWFIDYDNEKGTFVVHLNLPTGASVIYPIKE